MGCGASAQTDGSDPVKEEESDPAEAVVHEEEDLEGPQDQSIPSYWTNKRYVDCSRFSQMVYVEDDQMTIFNELMKETYMAKSTKDRPCPKRTNPCERQSQGCPCVRVDGDPGLPIGFQVRRVVRVENAKMWERYAGRRDKIRQIRHNPESSEKIWRFKGPVLTTSTVKAHPEVFEPLATCINEAYIWHGTTVRVALSIAQKDFDMQLAGTGRGAMYGPGAYFAESSTKADEYAHDEPNGYYDDLHAMLLCRVVMGKFYYTTKFGEEGAYGHVKDLSFDSVLADLQKYRKTFREFVLYDADQIYPEYVVLYSRLHRDQAEGDVERLAATPFHLELPVYWSNCHSNPREETFNELYTLRRTTCDLLRRLIAATSASSDDANAQEVKLRSARRLENSRMWNEYVTLKNRIRSWLSLQPTIDGHSARCTTAGQFESDGDAGTSATSVVTSCIMREHFIEEAISVDNLEAQLNEHFLWYAVSEGVASAIANNEHPVRLVDGRFGRGAYLSESFPYCLHRGRDDKVQDDDGVRFVLLCRVCCGEFYYTCEESEPEAHVRAEELGRHSILARPPESQGVGRHFVLLDSIQAYPEFIVELDGQCVELGRSDTVD
eukprot:TRINITY_DN49803_c0_g1_i1.p1 TRINITY_DN49803_c0_g1~~TRINITY_DN49803_c0_g1_i1.p1  ORF type:complete len:607 (-),score=91.35 TRINITY_DN49803_c0_g1_i1:38-1858(-)